MVYSISRTKRGILVKSLLLVIAILATSSFEAGPSYAQGCGTHWKDGEVLCLDYKGRSVSAFHCSKYTAEIGSRPPVPRSRCPNECCTETHTVDGVIVGTPEIKVAGSCNSTSRTTTCEERGDCPTPKNCRMQCTAGYTPDVKHGTADWPKGSPESTAAQNARNDAIRTCESRGGSGTITSTNCYPAGSFEQRGRCVANINCVGEHYICQRRVEVCD